jgi:hypothetical protein
MVIWSRLLQASEPSFKFPGVVPLHCWCLLFIGNYGCSVFCCPGTLLPLLFNFHYSDSGRIVFTNCRLWWCCLVYICCYDGKVPDCSVDEAFVILTSHCDDVTVLLTFVWWYLIAICWWKLLLLLRYCIVDTIVLVWTAVMRYDDRWHLLETGC